MLLMIVALAADVTATPADLADLRGFISICTTATRDQYWNDLPPRKREIARIICQAWDKGVDDGGKMARGIEIISSPAHGFNMAPPPPRRRR